jgi:glucose-1-phosphate adenylyltransferase
VADTGDTVLVLSGDHIYQMDYGNFVGQHLGTNADLTIATVECPLDDAARFGVVEVDGNARVTRFEEKPVNPRAVPSRPSVALVSMGVYMFKKSVLLKSLQETCGSDRGYDFGRDVIPSLIDAGRTYAYDFRDEVNKCPRYWRDIGTLDGFYETSMDLITPEPPFDPYANFGTPSQPTRHPVLKHQSEMIRNPIIGRSCDLSGTIVSAGVHVGDNAVVTNSVLMPGVRIGKGARLNRTIVDDDIEIPANFQAGYDANQDRRQHTVTNNGVVVVSEISAKFQPDALSVPHRGAFRQAVPGYR